MKKRNLWVVIPLIFSLSIVCIGCSLTEKNQRLTNTQDKQGNDTETTVSPSISFDSFDLEFTARDMEIGYDEAAVTKIVLDDENTMIEGTGAVYADCSVTITAEGIYLICGTLTNGSIIVDSTSEAKIQLIFDGINIHCETFSPVFIKQADKLFITLAEESENIVSDGSSYTLTGDTKNVDGAIFSKDDLTINGSGSLMVEGNYRHGIVSKDDLIITGGNISIDTMGHCLSGKDCLKISDGSFVLTGGEDALHASNTEAGTGFIYIRNGDFKINVKDDALHGETALIIDNGSIDIQNCTEGLEAQAISIRGGSIALLATDDGLNATTAESSTESSTSQSDATAEKAFIKRQGGMGEDPMASMDENCLIQISGGLLHIRAEGDGIDSNGSIEITGGEIYVDGPTNNGNGSFDYAISATISGGTLVAAGSTGMAQGFSQGSTQPFIMSVLNQSQNADTTLSLTDNGNTTIFEYTPSCSYQCLIISTPNLKEDTEYTLKTETQTISVTASTSSSNSSYGTRGHGDMGGRDNMRNGNNMTPPDMGQGDMVPPAFPYSDSETL